MVEENMHQLKRKRDNLLAIQTRKTTNENIEIKVTVKFYGREAIINITSQRRPRYMWRILEELEKHGLDVETSHIFSKESFVLLYYHVNLRGNITMILLRYKIL
jgi:hypothetical protein